MRVVHDAVGAANQMLATRTVAVVSLACVSRAGSSIGSSTGFRSWVRGGGGHQRYRAGAPVWRLYGPAPSGGALGRYHRTRFRGRLGGAQRKPSRIAGPSIRVAEVRVHLGAHLLVFRASTQGMQKVRRSGILIPRAVGWHGAMTMDRRQFMAPRGWWRDGGLWCRRD